jgi:predicted phosphoribosyltransferase
MMYRNREDAAYQLADALKARPLRDPLVLAIPRSGVVLGAVLAKELGAELDVVLSRKLRAPGQPEYAVGAISEDGAVYLNPDTEDYLAAHEDYLGEERRHQLAEIANRRRRYRGTRPKADVAGRSVIVVDDGIATGSTLIAALQVIRAQEPYEVIVAVPVGASERLDQVRAWCDEMVCLLTPKNFWAIGQFYEDFSPVDDEQVVGMLRASTRPEPTRWGM